MKGRKGELLRMAESSLGKGREGLNDEIEKVAGRNLDRGRQGCGLWWDRKGRLESSA